MLLVGGALLATTVPARVQAQAPNLAAQDRNVQWLIHRNALKLRHQLNYIGRQDQLVTKQDNLLRIKPANPFQARLLSNALRRIGDAIIRFNQIIVPAKQRLIAAITRTAIALARFKKIVPPNTVYAQHLKTATQTFGQQVHQAQEIVARPPATAFFPSRVPTIVTFVRPPVVVPRVTRPVVRRPPPPLPRPINVRRARGR
jgi:hypothetical protein